MLGEPGSTTEAQSVFTLHARGRGAGDLEVVSFRGHEEVSKLYAIDVLVSEPADQASTFERDVLGHPAQLAIQGVAQSRGIAGLILAVDTSGDHHKPDRVFHRVRLGPRLWLLGRRRHSRIFQDMTVREIVTAVLEHHRVQHVWSLQKKYRKRVYCVQHQETDLHFVRRLLSEEGIYFYFDHPEPVADVPGDDDVETVVFADTTGAYEKIAGSHFLPFRDPDRALANEEFVASFALRGKMRPGATRLKEFDFERPSRELSGQSKLTDSPGATSLEGTLEIYEHHQEYEGDDIDRPAAAIRLEQFRRKRVVAQGTSWCPRLMPGKWFTLEENGVAQLNADYVVTRVEHEGLNPEADGAPEIQHQRTRTYSNKFLCVPKDTVARPKPIARQLQQGLETAIVVGPAGEEIYTDPYGRIKVQFHWDLDGKRNEHSSCWIRPMQNWAGDGWGFQFIPRIGMEVLVVFVGGDTDRPMVVGCSYNGEHPPPYPLPEDKTRSGIRTRSSLNSDGYNELSFEDLAGSEQVRLRAQRNLDERVLNDHTTGVERNQTLSVGVNQIENVGVNQTISVGMNRAVNVGLNSSHRVVGNHSLSVGRDARVEVSGQYKEGVSNDRAETVGGAYRLAVAKTGSFQTGQNLAFQVEGDHKLHVRGRSLVSVFGNELHSVKGDYTVSVTGKHDVSLARGMAMTATKDIAITTAKKLVLTADEGLTLVCGETTLEISKDEVKISSKKVSITGGEEVALRGNKKASVKLDGDMAFTSANVKIKSSGASLELTSNAELKGSKVKLGAGSGASGSVSAESEKKDKKKQEWVFQLYEPDPVAGQEPKPLANVPVTATGHGPEPFSGSTDGGGTVKIPVIYERCTIDLTAGVHHFTISAGALDEIEDEDEKARQQLFNLGYGGDDADAWGKDELNSALSGFQRQNNINETPSLSSNTKSQLKSKYGA